MTEALTVYRRSELEATDCLFRYKKIWREGVDDNSDYARRGIGFHAVKHRYIQRLLAKQVPQDAEEAALAFVEGIAAAQTPDRLIPEIRQLCDFHFEYFELELDRFVAAEEKKPPYTCRTCGWLGYPDQLRVGAASQQCPACGSADLEFNPYTFTPDLVLAHPDRNELEIIDDKTFHVVLTDTQTRESFQGRYYVRHAMRRWPHFKTYRFTLSFVRLGKVVSVVYTPDDLEKLDREVEASIEKIQEAERTDHWPATPGVSCTYCELQCPVVDNGITIPKRLLAPAQAEQLGAWVLAADQMVSAAKKVLKAWCVANGAIDVQGVEWANRPYSERAYPLDMVLEQLSRMTPPSELDQTTNTLTLSHSALKKLFKVYANLETNLASVCREKTKYRFSAKKPGGDADGEGDES